MIARDVGVEVEPHALDTIVIGAIRRQEMKDDSIVERREHALGDVTLVDAVVVEDEVHATRFAISRCQSKEQLAEEATRLRVVADDVKAAAAHVERTREVVLLVLARREDASLLTAEHPIAADLRIEMDVDFINVEHRLVVARVFFESLDLPQNTLSPLTRPRAEHDRFRRAESCAELMQRTTHRARGDVSEAAMRHLQAKQLARPRRPHPSEVGRASREHLLERENKFRRDLAAPVVTPPIVETFDTVAKEPCLRPRHVRNRDTEQPRDFDDVTLRTEHRDDEKSLARRGVAAISSLTKQSPSLAARHSVYLLAHGASLALSLDNPTLHGQPRISQALS